MLRELATEVFFLKFIKREVEASGGIGLMPVELVRSIPTALACLLTFKSSKVTWMSAVLPTQMKTEVRLFKSFMVRYGFTILADDTVINQLISSIV